MQIVVNALLTNYEIKGDDNAEAILILHGWLGNLQDWIPIANHLCKEHRVILLDLPGCGKTAKPSDNFDTYSYANFVVSFLEKLNVQKCVIIGHSFGGRIGTLLSSNTKLVSKLFLITSAGAEPKNLKTIISKTLYVVFFSKVAKLIPKSLKKSLKNKLGSDNYRNSNEMRDVLVNVVNQDLKKYLPKIEAPTVIVWGDNDNILDVSQTKIFKKLIPNSTVRVVWGADHWPHKTHEKELIELLLEYL